MNANVHLFGRVPRPFFHTRTTPRKTGVSTHDFRPNRGLWTSSPPIFISFLGFSRFCECFSHAKGPFFSQFPAVLRVPWPHFHTRWHPASHVAFFTSDTRKPRPNPDFSHRTVVKRVQMNQILAQNPSQCEIARLGRVMQKPRTRDTKSSDARYKNLGRAMQKSRTRDTKSSDARCKKLGRAIASVVRV